MRVERRIDTHIGTHVESSIEYSKQYSIENNMESSIESGIKYSRLTRVVVLYIISLSQHPPGIYVIKDMSIMGPLTMA